MWLRNRDRKFSHSEKRNQKSFFPEIFLFATKIFKNRTRFIHQLKQFIAGALNFLPNGIRVNRKKVCHLSFKIAFDNPGLNVKNRSQKLCVFIFCVFLPRQCKHKMKLNRFFARSRTFGILSNSWSADVKELFSKTFAVSFSGLQAMRVWNVHAMVGHYGADCICKSPCCLWLADARACTVAIFPKNILRLSNNCRFICGNGSTISKNFSYSSCSVFSESTDQYVRVVVKRFHLLFEYNSSK